MKKTKKLKQELKDELIEHEVMRNHTALKVGGVADFYFEAKTVNDLVRAVSVAQKLNFPYFILGGGSNILFSDFGFPGLVIKNSCQQIAFMIEKSQAIVDSGFPLAKLIIESTSHELSGLEFLFGIPGTVGGAIYGNAGAWGQSLGDFVKSATLLMPHAGEAPQIEQVDHNWFEFAYRSSLLKKLSGFKKPVILSARVQLSKRKRDEIIRRINIFKEKRLLSQPIGQSAGCVFKNPIPKELQNISDLGSRNMPTLPKERTAGFMLEKTGAKKLKIGAARVSPKHANFVINTDGAKAVEIRQLIEQMRLMVQKRFEVNLEEEIEYIGQW